MPDTERVSTEPQNEQGVPQSPFCPSRSTRDRSQWSEPPLTYDSLGGQSYLLRQIKSRSYDYIVSSSHVNVIAFLTLDWESVDSEPIYQYYHKIFTAQIDPETLELYDAQDAFHPFAFAAKLQSEDFPTYHDILRMEPIEQAKWLEAMDKEIQDVIDRKCFDLVPRSEPINKGEQVINQCGLYVANVNQMARSLNIKLVSLFAETYNVPPQIIRSTKLLLLSLIGQLSACSLLLELLNSGSPHQLTSSLLSLKDNFLLRSIWNYLQVIRKPTLIYQVWL